MPSSACRCAIEQKLIPGSPTKGSELPKMEKEEMKILPLDSLGAFFEEAKNSGVFELCCIGLAAGLSRGEPLGPKRRDIDLDKGILHIRRKSCGGTGRPLRHP